MFRLITLPLSQPGTPEAATVQVAISGPPWAMRLIERLAGALDAELRRALPVGLDFARKDNKVLPVGRDGANDVPLDLAAAVASARYAATLPNEAPKPTEDPSGSSGSSSQGQKKKLKASDIP